MTLRMTIGGKEIDRLEVQGPISTLLTHKCCICGKVLRFTDGKGKWGDSHTYCEKHLEQVRNRG